MLKRLYIDNFRCFSNFEWRPGARVLLAGSNGSGKSTVFNVMYLLKQFLTRQMSTGEVFAANSITSWDSRNKQTFELSVESEGQLFDYRLVVEHDIDRSQSRVFQERLSAGNTLLYEYDDFEAHLYRDDGSRGPSFPTDWSRSLISTLGNRPDNQSLVRFRERMRRFYLFSPDPLRMNFKSERELRDPDPGLAEIASWLRHLQAEDSGFANRLTESLRHLLPCFSHYGLKSGSGDERSFSFHFTIPGRAGASYELPFDRLSDGQRALTALYIVLNAVVKPDTTIGFDEPDNFVSLREIQPWLLSLEEQQDTTGCQVFLVSHHPEIIDHLTHMEETMLLERDESGIIRIGPFVWDDSDGAPASELIARGWASNA